MRFTRAAKVAAFPLTALILVALVACQGPIGPKGAAGGTGPAGGSGPTGDIGPRGPVGAAALVAKSGDAPNILINDGKAADGTVVLGGPETYNVAPLFAGGKGEIDFTAAQADVTPDNPPVADAATKALYEAVIEEGTSVLTITWEGTTTTVLHTKLFTIDVIATDETGTTVTTQVMGAAQHCSFGRDR